MPSPTEVLPVDPRVTELLSHFPEDLFSDSFYRSWELVDRYGRAWMLELVDELGVFEALREPRSLPELRHELGFVESFRHALDWLVRGLVEVGLAVRFDDEPVRYQRRGELPPSVRASIREACLATDPHNEATLALLDVASQVYPRVARGEIRGQEALFGLGQTQLWLDYFHNENPIYAVNNRLAAHVACEHLPVQAGRVLEVGAGAGSGTDALLEAMATSSIRPSRYHFTEPSPFFRRRAERRLRSEHPDCPFEFGGLDIDQDLAAQGVEDGSCDLIYAVNVVHVARDLDRSLDAMRRALAPGGWLVAAESIRPFAGRTLSTELIFQILEDFWDVQLDPTRRPTPGFLTPEQWAGLLRDAGFSEVEVLPDHQRIREVYPRFCTGVVCGRA